MHWRHSHRLSPYAKKAALQKDSCTAPAQRLPEVFLGSTRPVLRPELHVTGWQGRGDTASTTTGDNRPQRTRDERAPAPPNPAAPFQHSFHRHDLLELRHVEVRAGVGQRETYFAGHTCPKQRLKNILQSTGEQELQVATRQKLRPAFHQSLLLDLVLH